MEQNISWSSVYWWSLKVLYSHSASLHLGVQIANAKLSGQLYEILGRGGEGGKGFAMQWHPIYGEQISSSHIPFNGCFRKSCWSAVTALNLSEKSVVPSPGWIAMLYYDARHPALTVTLLTQDGINGYQLTMREPDNMKDADKVISQQASCTEYCPCSCHCRLQILGAVLLLSVMKEMTCVQQKLTLDT